jgi:parallel beta-helix repeat protein
LFKTVSAIILFLLVLGTLALAFNVQPVWASGTIYIRADGSIDPPTSPIYTVDNITYTLTGNITSDADGIVIERDNIVVDGAGYTMTGSGSGNGTTLMNRSNVTVRDTTTKDFYNGIWLESSSNNTLSENIVTANYDKGIKLDYSSDNVLSGNNVKENNGGIEIGYSSDNVLSGNIVKENNYGINLYSSSNNTLSSNNIANNDDGIVLGYSSNNTLFENNVTANNDDGIWIDSSSENTLSSNNVANNINGIRLESSSNNTLSGNNVANNDNGIVLGSYSNNTLSENNIANNGIGIWLGNLINNNIVHNNFLNNTFQAYQAYPQLSNPNIWDKGNPSGGNYWSDYNGTDANHDGIGDTPYVIDANNTDHYPLMTLYIIPEFPSFLILSLFMITTLLAVIVYKKRNILTSDRG